MGNLKAELKSLIINSNECEYYLISPGEGKYPALIMYPDAFGVRPYMLELAKQLSSFGYLVLLPNILYRFKKLPVIEMPEKITAEIMPSLFPQIRPIVMQFRPEMLKEDAKEYIKIISESSHYNNKKIGAVGYCMGGAAAIRTAAFYSDKVGAFASFHAGNLFINDENSPHHLFNKIGAQGFIGHADHDPTMPIEQINNIDAEIEKHKLKIKTELFKDAYHGYTMKDLPAFNSGALEKHWKVLEVLFKENLES